MRCNHGQDSSTGAKLRGAIMSDEMIGMNSFASHYKDLRRVAALLGCTLLFVKMDLRACF